MDRNRFLWHDYFFCLLMQAISFLTPLAVIFVVKIIRRTDKTEIKEACLGKSRRNKVLPSLSIMVFFGTGEALQFARSYLVLKMVGHQKAIIQCDVT